MIHVVSFHLLFFTLSIFTMISRRTASTAKTLAQEMSSTLAFDGINSPPKQNRFTMRHIFLLFVLHAPLIVLS